VPIWEKWASGKWIFSLQVYAKEIENNRIYLFHEAERLTPLTGITISR
jgi:hypothetical protein